MTSDISLKKQSWNSDQKWLYHQQMFLSSLIFKPPEGKLLRSHRLAWMCLMLYNARFWYVGYSFLSVNNLIRFFSFEKEDWHEYRLSCESVFGSPALLFAHRKCKCSLLLTTKYSFRHRITEQMQVIFQTRFGEAFKTDGGGQWLLWQQWG